MSNMQLVQDRVLKTKPDKVLLPIPGPSHLKSVEMVDNEVKNILSQHKIYKEGPAERIIYQKVNAMKTANTVMSTLYNFSSKGSFPET